jgi:cholesterol oxidase
VTQPTDASVGSIFRLTLFRDIFVASGCGVGGGSLGYANTLYRARPAFYADPQIAGLADWEAELAPHYDEAERMLGVVSYDQDTAGDLLLKEYALQRGFGDTYVKTPVGVYLGEECKTVPDPFFGGEGPARTGCVRCGRCMIGCQYGAKNTLVKNYLYLAERRGARVMPERTVCDIRPLRARDGSDGYVVTHERSGAWVRRDRRPGDGAWRDRRGGRVGHQQAVVQLQVARFAAGYLGSAWVSRAHQQRIDPRGYRSR